MQIPTRLKTGALISAWISAVAICFAAVLPYEKTPSQSNCSPGNWPEQSSIEPNNSGFTLLIFLHPKCPCSKASLGELARITGSGGCGLKSNLKVVLCFNLPSKADSRFFEGELLSQARQMKQATLLLDKTASEAKAFGAVSSGETYLFDRDGKLCFQGGITAARGHEGDNSGRESIEKILSGRQSARLNYPVYGCLLESKAALAMAGRESD